MADRYEINHEGQIVVGRAARCADQKKMLEDLFGQFGWTCTEENQEGSCHTLRLEHSNGEIKTIHVYSGTVRNESRNAYEKKIQLGQASDPRTKPKEETMILGIYVYEAADSFQDAIFVGYPIDDRVQYPTNPSIRGTFVNKLLIRAKSSGFVYDKSHNSVGFRSEFIYYYLDNFYQIHYGDGEVPELSDVVYEEEEVSPELVFETSLQADEPWNWIVFGAPGTGKSYTVNEKRKGLLAQNENGYERVTFHPDYSYASFVGTYKPVPCTDEEGKEAITYKYVPGPFMRVLANALKNGRTDSVKPYLLIVEEINRANVAAVFGDVFQLLDRNGSGASQYPIQASEDMKKFLSEELQCPPEQVEKIRIPNNMFIWATMNSADQGVFPMDTAFKRRWDFTYIGIDDGDADLRGKTVVLGQSSPQRVEWNKLRKAINRFLSQQKINEDKQLGPYFLSRKIVIPEEGDEIAETEFVKAFQSKVIMYLFEDAARQKRQALFQGCPEESNKYSEICKRFEEKGIGIFHPDIRQDAEPEDLPGTETR